MPGELAKLVRARRQALGWSQTELALAMGSSPSRICKLEAEDPTVSPSLALRALDAMACPVKFDVDRARDPLALERLSPKQRRQVSDRLKRRRQAEVLAGRHGVDASDVEHALFNLTLPPWQRLARSFSRAGLRRLSPY